MPRPKLNKPTETVLMQIREVNADIAIQFKVYAVAHGLNHAELLEKAFLALKASDSGTAAEE